MASIETKATAPVHAPKKSRHTFHVHRVTLEKAKTGGYTAEHHFEPDAVGTSGGMGEYKPSETHVIPKFAGLHKHLATAFGEPMPAAPAANVQEPGEELPEPAA